MRKGSRLQSDHFSFLGGKGLQGLLNLLPGLFSSELLFFQDAQLALGPVILLMRLLGFLLSCSSFCCTAGTTNEDDKTVLSSVLLF